MSETPHWIIVGLLAFIAVQSFECSRFLQKLLKLKLAEKNVEKSD